MLKKGSIYKITNGENTFVGIFLGEKDRWGGKVSLFMTTAANLVEIEIQKEITIASTRLQPKIRESLIKMYKMYTEKENILAKTKELEDALRENDISLRAEQEILKKLSGLFKIEDIFRKFYNMSSGSTDPNKPEFTFSVEKPIEKYANPQTYSFLDTEYDGCLFITDHEAAIKECAFSIPASEINQLKTQLNHTSLIRVEDSCSLGDKNWLYANKDFTFRIKKNVKYNEIMEECKIIDTWIEKQNSKFK